MEAADANVENGADAPQAQPISIKFADASSFELAFKLKRITKLGKAMDAFSARVTKPRETLRFLFEGERLTNDATPERIGLEDGDIIDVHTEQIGGSEG